MSVYLAMMKRRPGLVATALTAFALFSTAVQAQTVTSVWVGRSNDNIQVSAAPPIINPEPPTSTYGGPFGFEISVQGTGISGITPPTFTAPAGAGILAPGPGPVCGGFFSPPSYNGGVLGYNALEDAWNFGAPQFNNFGGMNGGQRNCLFPNGTYTVTVEGVPVSLTLTPPASFVPNPHFTLSGGAWSGGNYIIDVNDTLTITSNAFPGFAENADGGIELAIEGPGGPLVQDRRFYSDDTAAPNSISYTIPPGTLTSGDDYSVHGTFAAIFDKSTGLPGLPDSTNLGFLAISTSLTVSAVGVLVDTTPPVITSLSTSAPSLWPPNHKMVAVTVTATVTDNVGPVTTRILSVTSNEPDNGQGDGDTANDIEITGPMTVNLRAERSGKGNGRIYTITVEAEDGAGNTTTGGVTVVVPKNGKK